MNDAEKRRNERDIARVRRMYEIQEDHNEDASEARMNGFSLKSGDRMPRWLRSLMFTDWDRVLDRVWESYNRGAYYRCVIAHRLFDDVRLENEYHVHETREGWVAAYAPDGACQGGPEVFGHEVHRYATYEQAKDAAWCLGMMAEVSDKIDGYWTCVELREVNNRRD
jgi:hypothetical protein